MSETRDQFRQRMAHEHDPRIGDAYENECEPGEFGFVPAFVQFLPPSQGGPYRGTAPKERRRFFA
jgi:hypothetical protein